jgi:hypothetical protein
MDDSAALEDENYRKKPAASDQVCIRITKETKKQERQQKISAKRRQFIIGLKILRNSKIKILQKRDDSSNGSSLFGSMLCRWIPNLYS